VTEYENPFEYEAELERAIEGVKTAFALIPNKVLTDNLMQAMDKLVDAKAYLKDELSASSKTKTEHLIKLWEDEYRTIPFWQLRRRAQFTENYFGWLAEKELELTFKAKEKYVH
jgi:hypothetical protein